MKVSLIESKLRNKGYQILYVVRSNRKCGMSLKMNGFIKHIFDSANQAAKHFGFIN